MLDRDSTPRGVRHIQEAREDHMPGSDRPRVLAADRRRSRMVAEAIQSLRDVAGRRSSPTRSGPDDPRAA